MAKVARARTGLILGKFLPPHAGHLYLVDFARAYVEQLTVLVCSLAREPIAGELRFRWMQELCAGPGVTVVHVTDEVPQTPEEHPEFWAIWREIGLRHGKHEVLFASEDYGFRMAEEIGAEYVPVDHARAMVPVSGTLVRAAPLVAWQHLPPPVRAHYVKRVCIFGPESTGKTTLARELAGHYRTVWVPEYARPLLDFKSGRCDETDIPKIARGQMASEDATARRANRVMFCDTDVLTTAVWSDVLFQRCPEWIGEVGRARHYDLTLLLDVDVPWVDDQQRFLQAPSLRRAFYDRCVAALEAAGRKYLVVRGRWDERLNAARAAVDRMLAAQPGGVGDGSER